MCKHELTLTAEDCSRVRALWSQKIPGNWRQVEDHHHMKFVTLRCSVYARVHPFSCQLLQIIC